MCHDVISLPVSCWVYTKQKIISLAWIPDGHIAFEKLKALVNNCPKLYFVDYNLSVILYTNASDYAHGASLPNQSTT